MAEDAENRILIQNSWSERVAGPMLQKRGDEGGCRNQDPSLVWRSKEQSFEMNTFFIIFFPWMLGVTSHWESVSKDTEGGV